MKLCKRFLSLFMKKSFICVWMENVDPFGTFYLQHSIFIDSE